MTPRAWKKLKEGAPMTRKMSQKGFEDPPELFSDLCFNKNGFQKSLLQTVKKARKGEKF